ncbi:DUF5683 domain-containing protein [Spirosoma sp. KNUC1025]|uniref:DUF5683 domain-containing protein n=1 Tax=Spirosoma sp. KNUC1025 TaxID=2894082 RepID=UPI00386BEA95|nr:DUF5683 domain-containing protein [Spirosoma sp. KNUC1025]
MKSFLVIAILLLLLPGKALFAQNPAIVPAPTPVAVDSTKQARSAADTIPPAVQRNGIKVGTSVLVPDDSTSLDTPDTIAVSSKQEAKIHKIIPKKATIRSLMFPGLGQIYNRQYWKLPFIYGGLGAAIFAYQFNQRNYLKYEAAYKEAYNQSAVDPIYGVKVAVVDGIKRSVTTLQQASNQYHQWRDLTIILTAAGWALNAVEANVAAHMKTFDLTDDISMHIEPNVLPIPGGIAPAVRIAFIFK